MEKQQLSASISKKTRFATIKDRYSYRLGQAIPNPDLDAEKSLNIDFTYTASYFNKLRVKASIFTNDISDIIQRVDGVQPGVYQLQNTGNARFFGYEISLKYRVSNTLTTGMNYSYISRENKSNPELRFTDVPKNKLFGFVEYHAFDRARIIVSSEYNSDRYSTSYGTLAEEFAIFNTKVSFKISDSFGLESGVNNIFDKNYSLVEGFPELGRNYFINLIYNL